MVRIGVNIPNELMKRLEPLKPELNISQVCREALMAKAEGHERMLTRLDNGEIMETVARAWEQEKEFLAVIEADWEVMAYEDAESWAKAARWDDWNDFHRRQDILKKDGRPPWEFRQRAYVGKPLQETKTFWDRDVELNHQILGQSDEFLDWLYYGHHEIDKDAAMRQYMTAWLAYINEVWKLISQRREEHYRKLLAERRPSPQPEIHELPFDDIQSQDRGRFRVVPHHSRLADGIDSLNLNHLIDHLDGEEFLAKEGDTQ